MFRKALGSLAGGVCVVACTRDGQDHAMTATAVTSVSLEPPLVLVCVARSARFFDAITEAGEWSVSILAEEGRPHAAWLARKGRPLYGQLDAVPHHRSAAGSALLEDSLAWLECRTHQQIRAGDHDIVVGEVVRATMGPGTRPLVYWRSGYRAASELRSDSEGERYS
jgi:flavin reductase (DIM6/NTAB) family NADH-FMN oxidoreductase RutF